MLKATWPEGNRLTLVLEPLLFGSLVLPNLGIVLRKEHLRHSCLEAYIAVTFVVRRLIISTSDLTAEFFTIKNSKEKCGPCKDVPTSIPLVGLCLAKQR